MATQLSQLKYAQLLVKGIQMQQFLSATKDIIDTQKAHKRNNGSNSNSNTNINLITYTRQEIEATKSEVEDMERKIDKLESSNNELRKTIRSLENEMKKYEKIRDEKTALKQNGGNLPNGNSKVIPKSDTKEMKEMEILSNDYPLNDNGWRDDFYSILNSFNINFESCVHDAVYTCEQASKFDDLLKTGVNCKNFFLSNKKQSIYFLFSCRESTKFRLNDLKKRIVKNSKIDQLLKNGTIKISGKIQFAKEKDLNSKLKLIGGSVTPFGMLNCINQSKEYKILFLLDKNLDDDDLFAKFHPLVNTASISIKMGHFKQLFQKLGIEIYVVDVDQYTPVTPKDKVPA